MPSGWLGWLKWRHLRKVASSVWDAPRGLWVEMLELGDRWGSREGLGNIPD